MFALSESFTPLSLINVPVAPLKRTILSFVEEAGHTTSPDHVPAGH